MSAAMEVVSVSCPKCGGEMYDNRLTKKNPKQPDWKCKRYKEGCEGVIWPAKGITPKPAPRLPQARSIGTPEFLPTEEEERSELQKKIGFDIRQIETTLALYQGVYEWYLKTIVPIATEADIGASPESVNAGVATILIQAKQK